MMHKLADTADVFVENYRPGALDKLGLGYAELSKRESAARLLLGVGLRSYRSGLANGRLRPDRGSEERRDGGCSAIPGEPPPLFRMPSRDMYTGIHGVAAVCARLVGRATSRQGPAYRSGALRLHGLDARLRRAVLHAVATARSCRCRPDTTCRSRTVYGVFAASDGNLVIAAQVDDAWKRLARAVGGDALANDARFHARRRGATRVARRSRIVEAWAKPNTVKRMPCRARCRRGALLGGADTSTRCSPILRSTARGMIIEQEHPVLGKVRLAEHSVPVLRLRHDADDARAAPRPAQSRDRGVLGYSEADIDAMVKDGVLYAEKAAH